MTVGASSKLLNALYLTFSDSSIQNGELQSQFEQNIFRLIQTKVKAKTGYGNISQAGLVVTFADGSAAKKRYFVYYDANDSCYKIKAGTKNNYWEILFITLFDELIVGLSITISLLVDGLVYPFIRSLIAKILYFIIVLYIYLIHRERGGSRIPHPLGWG